MTHVHAYSSGTAEFPHPALDRKKFIPVLRWWMLAIIALLAVGVYGNSIVNGFTLDDTGIIEGNPVVQNLEWTKIWESNYWPSPEGMPDVLYRPLTMWSYLANQATTPGQTWAFHAINIGLHGLVSMLVAVLAWRFVRNGAVAFVAGALFALHPIHTEVVANTVGRAELLAAFWSAMTLLMFLPREDLLEKMPKARGLWHGWLVAACFMWAILSKETPLALLGGLVFIDIWRWSHWKERPTLLRWMLSQFARYYLPLLVAVGVYMGMRIHAVGGMMASAATCHPVVNPLVEAGPIERIVMPFALLGKYVKLMFWPATLSSDYSYPSIVPSKNIFAPDALLGLMLVIGAGVAVIGRWRQWRTAVLLIAMMACSYLLVANIIRIGTIFGERLFYWPSAFGLILLSMGLVKLWDLFAQLPAGGKNSLRAIGAATIAIACVAMGWRTVVRNPDWKDNVNLAISTGRDNPESAKACFWAGSILILSDREDYQQVGLDLLHMSIERREDYGMPQWELAKYYQQKQQFGESYVWICRAARWRSGSYEVRMSLQAVKDILKAKRPAEYMPAIEAFMKQHPQDASAHLAMGLAQGAQGKLEESEASLKKALELDFNFLEAAAELGLVKLERGDIEGAIGLLKNYNIVCNRNPEARIELARAFMKADWEKYPSAMVEAKYNLDKASKMYFAGWQVRAAQVEYEKVKAETDARLKARVQKEGNLRADLGAIESPVVR